MLSVPEGANSRSFSDVRKSFALIHALKKINLTVVPGGRKGCRFLHIRSAFNVYKRAVQGFDADKVNPADS